MALVWLGLATFGLGGLQLPENIESHKLGDFEGLLMCGISPGAEYGVQMASHTQHQG